ncbi:MAG: hypothetical protein ACI8W6_001336, partial [Porticoccaceae bacterium]
SPSFDYCKNYLKAPINSSTAGLILSNKTKLDQVTYCCD